MATKKPSKSPPPGDEGSEIGWVKRTAFLVLLLLALAPVVALPLLPPLTAVDGALMVLFVSFAAGVTMHMVGAAYPAAEEEETKKRSPWWEQWAAFVAWCLFRTIVTFDSLPCHVGYAVCRPEDDVHLQILMDILAFVLLAVVFVLYYSIVMVMRREDATVWNELQLAYMAVTFLTMLLQLLFQPPISPVIYALNFLLIVYTVYVVVQLTVRYGAANKAGLALFFVFVVMAMSFVNRWAQVPSALAVVFGATSALALLAAALLGVSGFGALLAELEEADRTKADFFGKALPKRPTAEPARASLTLALLVAFLLLLAMGLLHFLFPPATVFDRVLELIASVGLSVLLRVMAFRRLPFFMVMLAHAAEIVALVLVLTLVTDASPEGHAWASAELAVCMLLAVGFALARFHLTPSRLPPRAKMVIGAFLVLAVVVAAVVTVAQSANARTNLAVVGSAVLGLVLMLAIVRSSTAASTPPPKPSAAATTVQPISEDAIKFLIKDGGGVRRTETA